MLCLMIFIWDLFGWCNICVMNYVINVYFCCYGIYYSWFEFDNVEYIVWYIIVDFVDIEVV